MMRRTLLGDHTQFYYEPEKGTGPSGNGGGTGTGSADPPVGGSGNGGDGDGDDDSDDSDDSDDDSGDGGPGGTKPAPRAGDKGSSQEDGKVKKLAGENKSLRTRLRQLEAAEEERKRKELSEVDRIKLDHQKEAERARAAEARLREERGMRALERTASKLGLDADLASRLVRVTDLEFDEDDGSVTNAETLLAELVEKWPNLKNGSAAADDGEGVDKTKTALGPTNPGRDKTRGKVFTREDVEKMTPEQINANWAAVAPLLQAGALNKKR